MVEDQEDRGVQVAARSLTYREDLGTVVGEDETNVGVELGVLEVASG